ncbi:NAD-dependent epimerase/dehydratase family protein [Streptomyces anulatus]|uniref:NAD-dependent epimerase/dehydratase family protein n=1 Tax=Streptomyces anulatus TaxID=1892 RepID=UPI001C27F038|nr:NAD-dependent epimerase/dehydratase family protein [Streptomyces anulatus]
MNGLLLIAGSSGTIGRHLATDLAARGIQMSLLGEGPLASLPPTGAEFIRADLSDASAVGRVVAGAGAVIHLAAIGPPPVQPATPRPGR